MPLAQIKIIENNIIYKKKKYVYACRTSISKKQENKARALTSFSLMFLNNYKLYHQTKNSSYKNYHKKHDTKKSKLVFKVL